MANFKCKGCGKTFDSRDDLRRHIFNEHLYPEDKAGSEHRVPELSDEDIAELFGAKTDDVTEFIKGYEWFGIKNPVWTDGGTHLKFLYDPYDIDNVSGDHICKKAVQSGEFQRVLIQKGPVFVKKCSDGGVAYKIQILT